MATERPERPLAAIFAVDVAGYSRLMGADEEGTLGGPCYRGLIAGYAHLGRLEEARAALHRMRLIDPVVMPHCLEMLRIPEHRELLLSGLRLALGEAA
jgi:pentatricopeptide repeat protein